MAKGATATTAMQASESREIQAYGVWHASRDKKIADQWAFHDFIRNAQIQVKAQFGEISDELQSVGLKK